MTRTEINMIVTGMREGLTTRDIWRRIGETWSEDTIKHWRRRLAREGHPDNLQSKEWTAREKETLIRCMAEGKGYAEAAACIGRTVQAVKRYIARHHLPAPARDYLWRPEEERQLIDLWHEGYRVCDIAAALGRPENGIDFKLRRLGLRRNVRRDAAPKPEIVRDARQDCFNHLLDLIEEFGGAPRHMWVTSGPLRIEQWRGGRAEYVAKCEMRDEQIPLSDSRPMRAPPRAAPSASYIGSVALMCADWN